MGATTTEGTGPGAVGIQRGPGAGRNSFVSLLDPHIVHHGNVTANDSGVALIFLPSSIQLPPERLTVIVSGKGFLVGKSLDSNGNVEFFIIAAADNSTMDFIVVDAVGNDFAYNIFLP